MAEPAMFWNWKLDREEDIDIRAGKSEALPPI